MVRDIQSDFDNRLESFDLKKYLGICIAPMLPKLIPECENQPFCSKKNIIIFLARAYFL